MRLIKENLPSVLNLTATEKIIKKVFEGRSSLLGKYNKLIKEGIPRCRQARPSISVDVK